MCKKLIYLISFALVLSIAGNASADLVAHWNLEEGSGATTTAAIGSPDADGTLVGATWVTADVAPISGSTAAVFFESASSDRIETNYVGILGQAERTVTAWIKAEPTQNNNAVFVGWGPNNPTERYSFRLNASASNGSQWALRLEIQGSYAITQTPLNDGQWHHVAVTNAEGSSIEQVSFYVDGQLEEGLSGTSGGGVINTASSSVVLGNSGHAVGGYGFDGAIDDVRIYDHVLSEAEILGAMAGEIFPYAFGPEPADGTLLEATWANLSWRPGGHAVSHDVYIGDNFDDVNDGTEGTFVSNQPGTTLIVGFPGFAFPEGLVPGTTYYWRIDEVNDTEPNSPWKGNIWSFVIPPKKAYDLSPVDGAQFVDPNVELNWTAGFGAKLHTLYFGDNFDDVNSGAVVGVPQADVTYTPAGPLELEKTYYWRVDEFDGAATIKGDVSSFRVKPFVPITNPNLLGWWKLDEGLGGNAIDWSGHNNDGILLGDPQWIEGYDGGALELDGSGDIVEMRDYKGVTGTQPRTCCAWIKTENLGEIISWGNNVTGQKWIFLVQTSNGTDGAIRVEVSGGYIVGVTDVRDGRWHHVAAVLEENAAPDVVQIKLYLDGVQQAISAQQSTLIDTASGSNVRIGQAPWGSRPFIGPIDDVRIYDVALTVDDIKQVMRGNLLLAWDPSPTPGSTPYIRDATPLNWSPGDNASQHDVYFDTDRDAVVDADASDTTGIYRGRQGVTIYTPAEGVEWGGGPYYWRIDEYNTDATISKGNVWSFSVTDYIGIEDFEDYNDYPPDEIFNTWIDGWGVETNGSTAGYPDPNFDQGEHFVETDIVHGGSQSMPLFYENNFKYSEATMTLVWPRDWTEEGVGVLSLWFHGDASNAAERMYVALNGSAVVYHDNPDAALIDEWTEWTIDLQEFAAQGVNLANVNTISIGFGDKNNLQADGSGLVFFDDIRLYRPAPPEPEPAP